LLRTQVIGPYNPPVIDPADGKAIITADGIPEEETE
jgi:hypothetical protein